MESYRRLAWIMILLLIPLFPISCQPQPPAPKPSVYYVSPVITYLKDCPGYDCKVVGELHQADQVEQVEVKDNWWRVKAVRGNLTGWLQPELLSPTPITPEIFYAAVDNLELRECPSPDCPFRKMLSKGDRVHKIAQNDQGWYRVLVEKDAGLGWVPVELVTDKAEIVAKAEVKSGEKSYLFAAQLNVNLYSLPLFSSKIVKALSLNEKVEKLAEHGQNWFKVRHLASGAEGWAAARDLKTELLPPEPPKLKKKFRKKPAPPKQPQPGEAPLEPEAM